MPRPKRKRQASKRARPVLLLGKRLRPGKPVLFAGGLAVELCSAGLHSPQYAVQLRLRTRGAGDVIVLLPEWRESAQAAARHTEETMLHLASALRQAGAH